MANLLVKDCNNLSGRCAIIEDDGSSSWLYLTHKNGFELQSDAFVYSPITPHETLDIEWEKAGNPPILVQEFASELAIRQTPKDNEISFAWSSDGESVAVKIKDEPIAMIVSGHKLGYSKSLVTNSAFGSEWDASLYVMTFANKAK